MKRTKLIGFSLICLSAVITFGCSSEVIDGFQSNDKTSVAINLEMDVQTREARPLDFGIYDVKVYVYSEKINEEDGSASYVYLKEQDINKNLVSIEDLIVNQYYKAVFLAVPKSQNVSLPDFTVYDTKPSYDKAEVPYILENETENDIFRSVVTFKPSSVGSELSTVLTRQNGALEIRLKNFQNMSKVVLHAKGHKSFFMTDGTGGQVLTVTEEPIAELKKIKDTDLFSSEVSVRLNLLPQENIEDPEGNDFYLEIYYNDEETPVSFPIKSDHERIPIYPNQVTWLTLKNGEEGFFEVDFYNPHIDLEDGEWDGWIDKPSEDSSHKK